MRFALDVSALGKPSPSGIKTVLRHLVPELAGQLGDESLLLWQLDLWHNERPIAAPQHDNVRLHATRFSPRLLETLWRRIDWPRIEAFTGPIDIFHSIQGRMPPSRRARLALTLHDFRHCRLRELYPGVRWFPREIARADHFLAVSACTRNDAIEFLQIPPDRITVVPNGPPEPPPPASAERRREILARWGVRQPYLFCSSSTDRRKNAAAAVRAFRILNERRALPHQLVIVGGVHPLELDAIRAERAPGVTLTGVVTDEEYWTLLENAGAVVHPSLVEGFGLPVLEAFLKRVPQAVARGTSLTEVAEDAAIAFDPRDPDELAQAMETLLTDTVGARRLVERGTERLKDFSWERTAQMTLAVYRSLAASERDPIFRGRPTATTA